MNLYNVCVRVMRVNEYRYMREWEWQVAGGKVAGGRHNDQTRATGTQLRIIHTSIFIQGQVLTIYSTVHGSHYNIKKT